MADSVSTLALRVNSQTALQNLNEFGFAAANLGGTVDVLKGKLLQFNARFLGMNFARKLVGEAAEGQEAVGKFESVLGRFGNQGAKVADSLVKDFNYSSTAAKSAVSGMVDVFTKAGISLEESLNMAETLNKRAADLEAFTNAAGGVEHVASQLTSGTLGNVMAVRSLGIVLSAEAVEAQMAKEKTEGLTFATERAAQMHARVSVMLQQSASAHGQVSRESDNYANRARYLRARVDDLKSGLGDALIPTFTKAVDVLAKGTEAFNALSPATKSTVVAVGAATGALITSSPWIKSISGGIKFLTGTVGTLTAKTIANTASTVAETAAQQAQTVVQTQNTVASNAATLAKNAEAAARTRNAAAMNLESMAGAKSALGGTVAQALPGASRGMLGTLATPFTGMTRVFTGIARALPIVGKLGAAFTTVAGVAATVVATIGAVVGAFELLKRAPQWVEVAFDKLPGVFSNLASKAIAGVKTGAKAAWNYGKELVVGATLGAGQLVKRLAGLETQASREYALNKQIEANNAKRAALQEQQRLQLAAEGTLIQARQTVERSRFNAELAYNQQRENDAVKLFRATSARDDLAKQIKDGEKELADSLATIQAGGQDKAALEAAEERAKELTESLDGLNQRWLDAASEVDKLAQTVNEATKSFRLDQDMFTKTRDENVKTFDSAVRQQRLATGTFTSRRDVLSENIEVAKGRLGESERAEGLAENLNKRAETLQGRLYSQGVSDSLFKLESLAKGGDFESETAVAEFESAIKTLSESGYEIDEQLGVDNAKSILEMLTEQRKKEQEELEDTIRERDEYLAVASERGSRFSELADAQKALSEHQKAYDAQRLDEERKLADRTKQQQREARTFYQTLNESLYQRTVAQLQDYYGENELEFIQSKYNLLGRKTAQERSDSQASLVRQQSEIQSTSSLLALLDVKFREGSLTDDESKERDRLAQELTQAENQFAQDYRDAVQKRMAAEDELSGLERSARKEFLSNVRQFVDAQGDALKEELTKQAEYERKRFEEYNEAMKEERKPVESLAAISSGSSTAFEIANRIYNANDKTNAPEKNIEKSAGQIEQIVAQLKDGLFAYFADQQNGYTVTIGY